jgi:hypothetical protein
MQTQEKFNVIMRREGIYFKLIYFFNYSLFNEAINTPEYSAERHDN